MNSANTPFYRCYPTYGITVSDLFAALWLVVMPVNSVLLIPSIQGTTPAYLLGFASLILVFVPGYLGATSEVRSGYIKAILGVLLLWMFTFCGSQIVNVASPPSFASTANLINPNDTRIAFRSTIITQSLYLAGCLSIFLFFRYQFQDRWWNYVHWGAWFLAGYGIYEWLYFLIFQTTGDFLVNREFDNIMPGSWSQLIGLGPYTVLRIKSTQGEPSFLSIVVLPYLYLALEQRRRWLAGALLFVAVFSTSTSAFLGLALGVIATLFLRRKMTSHDLFVILILGMALLVCYLKYPGTFETLFTEKLSGRGASGETRQVTNLAILQDFAQLQPLQWLSGMGFGYIYSNVGVSVLFNTGIVGFGAFALLFLGPIIGLPSTQTALALKVGILVIFLLLLISVSETFLPTTWMFLGLAWRELARFHAPQRSVL